MVGIIAVFIVSAFASAQLECSEPCQNQDCLTACPSLSYEAEALKSLDEMIEASRQDMMAKAQGEIDQFSMEAIIMNNGEVNLVEKDLDKSRPLSLGEQEYLEDPFDGIELDSLDE